MSEIPQSKSKIIKKLKMILQQFPSQKIFKVMQKIYPIEASTDPITSLSSAMQKYAKINASKSIPFSIICNNIWDLINSQDQKISKAITKQIIGEIIQPTQQKWILNSQNSSTNFSQMYSYPQVYSPPYTSNPMSYSSYGNYSNSFYRNFNMQYPQEYPNYNISNYSNNQSNMNVPYTNNNVIQIADNANSAVNLYQNNSRSYQKNNFLHQINTNINQSVIKSNNSLNNLKNINITNQSSGIFNNSNNDTVNLNLTVDLNNSQKHLQNQNSSLNKVFSQNLGQSKITNGANINTKNLNQIQLQKKISSSNYCNNLLNQKTKQQSNTAQFINIESSTNILANATKNLKQSSANNNNSKIDNKTMLYNPSRKQSSSVNNSKINIFEDYSNQSSYVINLSQKNKCICGKETSVIQKQYQQKFKCFHCKQFYHFNCQKRSNNCLKCYIKFMIPTHRVKNQIFVGVLRKNKKKHEIHFQIQNISKIKQTNANLQARCIRITENTQNINLFPDIVSIQFNKQTLKEFQPLHKQSSLKYRKDQPLLINNYLIKKANKVILTEKIAGRDNKQDRIDYQNHIFGIYIVQQQTSKNLTKQISFKYLNQFNQSKQLLDNNFKLTSDQLTCQVLKIPLTCTLTTQKITIPARGIFCNHFQCFDLQNYITMISMSATPKWFCPLCKKPAYHFVIDSILTQIIKLSSDKEATHTMFKQDGTFQIFSKDQILKNKIKNIYDLPIESKFKRFSEVEKQVKQQTDNKPKKKILKQIPPQAQIIDLSD